ncbi:hypothetical protein D9615_007001 [Tricholomella constricta]|uniref:Uncharacterized protein n=1 Tax=Tricholomella constricta TaxID=117010 RepID=A0A8H5M2U0_9AGAR|nr:hypothetical protein D9615_007001 [Tricholomella constricta]
MPFSKGLTRKLTKSVKQIDIHLHPSKIFYGVIATIFVTATVWLVALARGPSLVLRFQSLARWSRRPLPENLDVLKASITNAYDMRSLPCSLSHTAITGRSRSISLSVGDYQTTAGSDSKARQKQNQLISRRLFPTRDPNPCCEVVAKMCDSSWATDNLSDLMKELQNLQRAIDVNRWQKLSLLFPNHLPSLPDPIPVHFMLPPNLHTLVFKGHEPELRSLFCTGPHLPTLTRLTSLTLHCKLSIHDCAYLLFHGRGSLAHFEVQTLVPNTPPIFESLISSAFGQVQNVSMERLETLIISALCNQEVQSTLDLFAFPRLRTIDFDFARRLTTFAFLTIPFSSLKEVRLRCDMTARLALQIRNSSPGAKHAHVISRKLESKKAAPAPAPRPSNPLKVWINCDAKPYWDSGAGSI